MTRARKLQTLLGTALAALFMLVASGAQAASLRIPDAEATVGQGESATFTISLSASGAFTCDSSSMVFVDSDYLVNSAGQVTSDTPTGVTFTGAGAHGAGNNCDPTWDGAPAPYALTATAAAASDTALGDYTAPINYTVENFGSGAAGKLSSAGTVNVTIHVVAPPVIEQPAVVVPPPAQLVLGERVVGLRPTLGKTELLELISGTVLYQTPGGNVTTLHNPVLVPNGTRVDATNGTVRVTIVHDSRGGLDTAAAWNGAFTVRQVITGAATFTLSDGLSSRAGQGARRAARSAIAARKRKKKRVHQLWVNGTGNFQTKGQRASAIVRGTTWLTEDVGADTRVAVNKGVVAVRDFSLHRTVIVRAGHSYTARARRAVAHRVPAFTGRAG